MYNKICVDPVGEGLCQKTYEYSYKKITDHEIFLDKVLKRRQNPSLRVSLLPEVTDAQLDRFFAIRDSDPDTPLRRQYFEWFEGEMDIAMALEESGLTIITRCIGEGVNTMNSLIRATSFARTTLAALLLMLQKMETIVRLEEEEVRWILPPSVPSEEICKIPMRECALDEVVLLDNVDDGQRDLSLTRDEAFSRTLTKEGRKRFHEVSSFLINSRRKLKMSTIEGEILVTRDNIYDFDYKDVTYSFERPIWRQQEIKSASLFGQSGFAMLLGPLDSIVRLVGVKSINIQFEKEGLDNYTHVDDRIKVTIEKGSVTIILFQIEELFKKFVCSAFTIVWNNEQIMIENANVSKIIFADGHTDYVSCDSRIYHPSLFPKCVVPEETQRIFLNGKIIGEVILSYRVESVYDFQTFPKCYFIPFQRDEMRRRTLRLEFERIVDDHVRTRLLMDHCGGREERKINTYALKECGKHHCPYKVWKCSPMLISSGMMNYTTYLKRLNDFGGFVEPKLDSPERPREEIAPTASLLSILAGALMDPRSSKGVLPL